MSNNQLIYDPSIFDQPNLDGAKRIVLTAENGISTDERWNAETPWLMNLITKHIKPSGLVVDYGCGVGRLAQPLVGYGYSVIGVDTSSSMREHATHLISSERFVAMTPEMLDQLVGVGVKADTIIAVWILQHCFDLEVEVDRLYKTLNLGGVIGIADMRHRAIPTNQGWVNDGKSVKESLMRRFTLIQQYPYCAPSAPKNLQDNAYIAFFRKDH